MRIEAKSYSSHSCISPEDLPEYDQSNTILYGGELAGTKLNAERILVKGAGFFPDSLIITRSIIPIQDTTKIFSRLVDGISTEHTMGVRTMAEHSPRWGGKLPWVMGIDNAKNLVRFFTDNLPEWKTSDDLHITHLILMDNLPEIGTMQTDPKQFVARLRTEGAPIAPFDIGPITINMDLMPGTNQLRDIDDTMTSKDQLCSEIFQYSVSYDRTMHKIISSQVTIGTKYLKDKRPSPKVIDTNEIFSFPQEQRDLVLDGALSHLDTMFSILHDATFDPNIRLMDRLEFLSSIGLNIVEFQGFSDDSSNKHYARIYGLRGKSDETHTELRHDTENIEELPRAEKTKSFNPPTFKSIFTPRTSPTSTAQI